MSVPQPLRRLSLLSALGLTCCLMVLPSQGCGSKPASASAAAAKAKAPPSRTSRTRQQTPVQAHQANVAEPAVATAAPKVVSPPQPEPAAGRPATIDDAETLLNGGHLNEAEAILLAIIEASPQDYRAHALYGSLLYTRGIEAREAGSESAAHKHFLEAYEHAAIAAALAEDSESDVIKVADLHHEAGDIAAAAGLGDDALEHFRTAGRMDPMVVRHPLAEAQLLIELGRHREAAAVLKRVLEIDPDEAFAYALLAEVDCELALRTLRNTGAIAAGDLDLHIRNVKTCHSCGRTDEALEVLLALDDRDRAGEAATAGIADAFQMQGESGKAAIIWELRYMRHPGDWRAALHAAEAWLKADAPKAARWWYRQVQQAAPDEPEVRALSASF